MIMRVFCCRPVSLFLLPPQPLRAGAQRGAPFLSGNLLQNITQMQSFRMSFLLSEIVTVSYQCACRNMYGSRSFTWRTHKQIFVYSNIHYGGRHITWLYFVCFIMFLTRSSRSSGPSARSSARGSAVHSPSVKTVELGLGLSVSSTLSPPGSDSSRSSTSSRGSRSSHLKSP